MVFDIKQIIIIRRRIAIISITIITMIISIVTIVQTMILLVLLMMMTIQGLDSSHVIIFNPLQTSGGFLC